MRQKWVHSPSEQVCYWGRRRILNHSIAQVLVNSHGVCDRFMKQNWRCNRDENTREKGKHCSSQDLYMLIKLFLIMWWSPLVFNTQIDADSCFAIRRNECPALLSYSHSVDTDIRNHIHTLGKPIVVPFSPQTHLLLEQHFISNSSCNAGHFGDSYI